METPRSQERNEPTGDPSGQDTGTPDLESADDTTPKHPSKRRLSKREKRALREKQRADSGKAESHKQLSLDQESPDQEAQEQDPPASWDGEVESFGAWLTRQRRVRGIELREIADDSKISMTYLQAFEEDRFDILPAEVFAKGFLRHYANYVGLDPEEAINFFLSAHRGAAEVPQTDEPAQRRSGDTWRRLGVPLLGAALILLALAWALLRGTAEPPPAPPRVEPTPVAVTTIETDPRTAAPTLEESPVPPETQSPLRVTLDFSAECWIEATVDGQRSLAENKIQGESLLLEATGAIELTIGNIDAVDVEVNGHPFLFDEVRGTKVRTQVIDLETIAALVNEEG